jgi:hypothetical protein
MDTKKMLDVVTLRFQTWHPVTSTFGEKNDVNGFRIEIDNYNQTGRILIKGKVKFESLDAAERFKWDISGNIFEQDKARIAEVQRVVANALA